VESIAETAGAQARLRQLREAAPWIAAAPYFAKNQATLLNPVEQKHSEPVQ
jgi:hypothetical protein